MVVHMCWTVREYYPNWWTLLLVCLSTQRWHSKWLLPEQGIASVLQKIIQCQQILINTKWPISNQILSLLTILPLYKSHNAKFYSEIDDYQKTIEVNLIYLTKLCMSFILSTKLKILNLTTESKLDSCHRNWIGNFDLKISIQTQPHSAWIHM